MLDRFKDYLQQLADGNSTLAELLVNTTEQSNNALSFDELCANGYILFGLDENTLGDAPDCDCRIIVMEDNDSVGMHVLCKHSCWMLDEISLRCLEIILLIVEGVHGQLQADSPHLYLSTLHQIEIDDTELGGYSVVFSVNQEPEEKDTAYELLLEYKSKLLAVAESIAACDELKSLLVNEEARMSAVVDMTWKDLVRNEYIRFTPHFTLDDIEEKSYVLVDFGLTPQLDIRLSAISSLKDNILSNGKKRIREISRLLKGAFLSRNPDATLTWNHINKIETIVSCMMSFRMGVSDIDRQDKSEPEVELNFFCDNEALAALLELEIDAEYPETQFSVEYIEFPYKGFYLSDDNAIRFIMSTRSDFGCVNDEAVKATIYKENGLGEATAPEQFGQDIGLFIKACIQLNKYIQINGLEDRYEYLNQPFEGILLYSENGKLCHKLVAGSERPNLLCKYMFVNLTHMGRPYPDDIAEGIQKALTPQEEQEKQAEAGDQELMESFSIGYLRGINGCEENPEKAFYWTKKLAETGRADYQFNIGLYYAKGHGVKRDFRKAIEWEQKAQANGDTDAGAVISILERVLSDLNKANSGDAHAQANLVGLYSTIATWLDEHGAEDDYKEALYWAKKSAEQKCVEGIYELALCYEHGRGTTKDSSKAAVVYRKAALQGHAPSQWNLACLYMNGDGIEQDKKLAIEWATKAAKQDYDLALEGLTKMQYGKESGTTEDSANIMIELTRDKAESGEPEAQAYLALALLDKDNQYEEALEWAERSAKQDNATGLYVLGLIFEHGAGIQKDEEKAFFYFEKSAQKGFAEAEYKIAICYMEGMGVEVDFVNSLEWMKRAAADGSTSAQQFLSGSGNTNAEEEHLQMESPDEMTELRAAAGDIEAQKLLGACYLFGEGGITQNEEVGFSWMLKAAEQGDDDAQAVIALCYENGVHVDVDFVKAIEWYEKAAEQGNPEYQHALGLCYMNQIDDQEINHQKAMYWLKIAGENGHEMSKHSYEFWTYVDSLKANGEIENGWDFGEIMNYITHKASAGDVDAAKWVR